MTKVEIDIKRNDFNINLFAPTPREEYNSIQLRDVYKIKRFRKRLHYKQTHTKLFSLAFEHGPRSAV